MATVKGRVNVPIHKLGHKEKRLGIYDSFHRHIPNDLNTCLGALHAQSLQYLLLHPARLTPGNLSGVSRE